MPRRQQAQHRLPPRAPRYRPLPDAPAQRLADRLLGRLEDRRLARGRHRRVDHVHERRRSRCAPTAHACTSHGITCILDQLQHADLACRSALAKICTWPPRSCPITALGLCPPSQPIASAWPGARLEPVRRDVHRRVVALADYLAHLQARPLAQREPLLEVGTVRERRAQRPHLLGRQPITRGNRTPHAAGLPAALDPPSIRPRLPRRPDSSSRSPRAGASRAGTPRAGGRNR